MNNPITQSTDETCNIDQDLLPLYYDDVCSPSSKRLVEKHLKTCEKCQNTYNELKNDSIDSMIKKEADSVLKQHEKKEKTAAYKTGCIHKCCLHDKASHLCQLPLCHSQKKLS